MKYIAIALVLTIWMVLTVLLAISVLGMIVFIEPDNVWLGLGKKLVGAFYTDK